MKKIVFIISAVFLVGNIFSQKLVEENLPQIPSELKQADELPSEGTYQIIVSDIRVHVALSDELLYDVTKKRKQNKYTYIIVSEYVKIKILPYSVIKTKGFIPVKQYKYAN